MGQKIKYFVYALVPAIVLTMIQAMASIIVMIGKAFTSIASNPALLASNDPTALINAIMYGGEGTSIMEPILMIYLIMAVIVEALVLIFVFKQKSLKGNISNINGRALGGISLATIGLGLVTNVLLNLAYIYFPKLMEAYEAAISAMGLGDDMSPVTIISAVILAPIVEEICFRGMTLYLFEKAFNKFWAANLCQAVIFGVIHGNVIQGLYAFTIGLVFGYIRKRYNTIYASIIGHILFNFYGTIITSLIGEYTGGFNTVISIALGTAILVGGLYIIKPAKESRQA